MRAAQEERKRKADADAAAAEQKRQTELEERQRREAEQAQRLEEIRQQEEDHCCPEGATGRVGASSAIGASLVCSTVIVSEVSRWRFVEVLNVCSRARWRYSTVPKTRASVSEQ